MRRRRAGRALSWLLAVAGVLLLADAGATLAWQEPLTALRAALAQDGLERDLARLDAAGPPPADLARAARVTGDRRRVAVLADALDRRTGPGTPVGRLAIPRLGLRVVVVHGDAPADLRRGPGTIAGAPLPGARGTAAIAGHRTTYGAPFRDIDQLRAGDAVIAAMPSATLRYRVTGARVVAPSAVSVLRRAGHDRLVLVACHPRFSAAQRIVVTARLAAVVPRRAGALRTAFGRSAIAIKGARG
ncbi:MAG TPA: class E sortase [Solirubrobacteraceae bacterium]|nr:class E sortase [Solirubrobacteraceae bacterium]